MGISFKQYAVIGFRLAIDECLVRESDPVYEEQNRYDTKTGKKIGVEKVLVKEAVEYYKYRDIKEPYFYELLEAISEKYGLDYAQKDDYAIIGIKLEGNNGDYKFDGIENSFTFEELESVADEVYEKIQEPVFLHLLYNIG